MFLQRFRLYSVHLNPAAKRPYETAEFVHEGFNFYAFLFGPFWALYNRLWILGFVLICLDILIGVLGQHYGFHPFSGLVLNMGIRLLVGFQGNDALRERLNKQGYVTTDMVTAHTLLHAQQRFYDRYMPAFSSAASTSKPYAEA